MITKIWNWLVVSSEDPEKLSMTVKGLLGTVGSAVILVSPLVHLHIGDQQVTAIIDLISQIVISFCAVISGIATILGFARKIWSTIKSPSQPQQ